MTQGSFPLTDGSDLPNVTVAFPGEHWSNRKASGAITPGEAVIPVNSGGSLYMKVASQAASGAAVNAQVAVALRTVDVPDVNNVNGPNEIKNTALATGDYVHAYYSGGFHLTLIVPDATWAPGDVVGWNPSGARPTGKSGTGAWDKNANCPTPYKAIFEVVEWRPYSSGGTEGILTVRSLRGQF